MDKKLYFLAIILIAVGAIVYKAKYYTPLEISEMKTVKILVGGSAINVRVAETVDDQEKGLMGELVIKEDEGMLFKFEMAEEKQFWNEGMIVPFDLIWIKNGRVAGIEPNIPPPGDSSTIYSSPGAVDHALELAGGWSGRRGLRVGDKISGL